MMRWREQIDSRVAGEHLDVGMRGHGRGQGQFDRLAGGVGHMNDARLRMPALQSQRQIAILVTVEIDRRSLQQHLL